MDQNNIDNAIDEIPYEQLVFNRPARTHAPGYVCFTFQTGPVMQTLEEIRAQFQRTPKDQRVGNLHMLTFSLGEDRHTTAVHLDRTGALSINLFLRAAG